ncbi:MAG: hypothetical protein HY307_02285 [Arcobacter sp.]|nr:hypothetical protein [Arcobacter sp.]
MKKYIASSILVASSLLASDLKVEFMDKKWDGITVPKDEVCSNYNLKAGSTPVFKISNIPENGAKIVFSYNDKTFTKMDNGGHGVVAYSILKGSKTVEVPSLLGETFKVDKGFEIVKPHTGTRFNKTAGAYLAPCSGGKNNTYSVTVTVVDDINKSLATTEFILGKF